MALNGQLRDLPASEALGFIARQEKSGYLDVTTDDGAFVLYFNRGNILQARRPGADPEDTFIALLKELRIIPPEHWKILAGWQVENPDRDPLEHLMEVGIATREGFEDLLALHAQGVVDQLMEARDGFLSFESRQTDRLFAVPLAEKTEFIMMEAGRRSDETNLMLSEALLPSSTPRIKSGQRPIPENHVHGAVLRLVDGRSSIGRILDSTRLPRNEIVPYLQKLVDDGVIEVIKAPRPTERIAQGAETPASSMRVALLAGAAVIVGTSVYVGLRLWGQLP